MGPTYPENETSSSLCKWDYSGLGMDYQLLAGPSFMAVFTVAGVLWGLAAGMCMQSLTKTHLQFGDLFIYMIFFVK